MGPVRPAVPKAGRRSPGRTLMRVAGFQMRVTGEVADNTEAILGAVARAADEGARVLLTPEGSLSGYTPDFDPQTVTAALETVTAAAASRSVGLALGTCFIEADGLCYNQVRFYEPDGTYRGFHAKTLRCGTLADPPRGEIERYAEAPLRTRSLGGIAVGGLICNDLWANPACTPMPDPHLTQRLALAGASVIFHAVNGGRDGGEWSRLAWAFHESNLRLRARAAGVWLVTVDSCEPIDLPCSSPSGVIDPTGDWVCRAPPQGEALFAQDIAVEGTDG